MNIGTTGGYLWSNNSCTDIHINKTAVIYFIQQFNIFQVNIKPVTLYDFVPQMQIATNKASTEHAAWLQTKVAYSECIDVTSHVFSFLNESAF